MWVAGKVFGWLLYVAGVLAVLAVDIAASGWLLDNHGIGWVIVSWIFLVPLLVIPFLAGLGLPFGIAMLVTLAGHGLVVWASDEGL